MPNFFCGSLVVVRCGPQGLSALFDRPGARTAAVAAGYSYLLVSKGSAKTIRMSLSREQPPARVERAQQEQDYAASRSGHAGCRLFFLRCKRECGGLKPLPGAIVGFCVSCLFRTHPSRHVPRRTTPAWQKRRSERCGLKARAEGRFVYKPANSRPEPALGRVF